MNEPSDPATPAPIGGWHLALAVLGIAPIVFLAAVTFRSLFTTAGDVLALISYIAAVIGAAFGVQIVVRGAVAAAENKINKGSALEASKDLDQLKKDVALLSRTFRTIATSPEGQDRFVLEPGKALRLSERIEIAPSTLEGIQTNIEKIGRTLGRIAK